MPHWSVRTVSMGHKNGGEMFTDTTICPVCGDENAYFNGIAYECPDCGHEWHSSLLTTPEETDDEKLLRMYRQEDISRVGESTNSVSIQRLFSPSYRFSKWHTLFRETGVEEDYHTALVDELLESCSYTSLLDIEAPKGLADQRRSELFRGVLRGYLESRDELPAFPRIGDWAEYIDAPIDVLREGFPENGIDIMQFLPLTLDEEDFTILFRPRLVSFYDRFQAGSSEPVDYVSIRAVEDLFTEFVTGEKAGIDDEAWFMRSPLRKEFEKELKAIQSYREDLSSATIKKRIVATRPQGLRQETRLG